MVLLSASSKLNQWLGPRLLRLGIQLRYALGGGVVRDNPWVDSLCGISVAQKLIQIEVHDEAQQAVVKALKENPLYTEQDEAATRLNILERYLRPALLPNEQWSDVRKWQFHFRLMKWIRTEFLTAKHGGAIRKAFVAAPVLKKSPQIRLDAATAAATASPKGQDATLKFPFNLFSANETPTVVAKNETYLQKLPSSAVVARALSMTDWSLDKDMAASRRDMARVASDLDGSLLHVRGGNIAFARIDDHATLATQSLQDVLEVAGGHVVQCGPFNALCEELNIYQLWTRDYVEQLGRYILKRTDTVSSPSKETVVLDVGAGDGLLAQLLRDFFEMEQIRRSTTLQEPVLASAKSGRKRVQPAPRRVAPSKPVPTKRAMSVPTVIASDNGTWGISPIGEVEQQSVQEAIDMYTSTAAATTSSNEKHVIVLCSWMPMNEDWTAIFRNGGGGRGRGVDEYILIGECDDGQCGDNWETWGNPKHLLDDIDGALSESSITYDSTSDRATTMTQAVDATSTMDPKAPYVVDGYERHDLVELTPYQFSRFDCRSSKFGRAVSFRKKAAQK